MKKTSMSTQKLVLGAILTALVVLLQFLGSFIKLGPFSVSLVLIPIVVGAATCGAGIGAWLGLVFGLTVLWSGDAAAFLAVTVPGTVATVIAKGVLCGYLAAVAYKAIYKLCASKFANNAQYIAVAVSAVVCPLVNTGVFLIGCYLFFMDTVAVWAGSDSVAHYIIFVLVGGNFIFELITNMILSPAVSRILNIKNKF